VGDGAVKVAWQVVLLGMIVLVGVLPSDVPFVQRR
jgi:hypothetical protein